MFEHLIGGCQCVGKKCNGPCGEVKCHEAFYLDARGKYGRYGHCKACHSLYHQNKREHRLAGMKAYREKSQEATRRRHKSEYSKHADSYKARAKARRETHREQISLWRRGRLEQTRAWANLYWKRRYYDPTDDFKQRRMIAGHRRRTRRRQAGKSFTYQEWEALKAQYNYTCLCCGKQEPDIKLTPDHVIPLVQDGSNTIDNIQPLCRSCNARKGAKTIDYRNDEFAIYE